MMSAREWRVRAGVSLVYAIGVTVFGACSAEEARVPSDWKTDCVGRTQLSLPAAVDVAGNSFKMLEAEYRIGTQQPRFEFSDGQQADYSGLRYDGVIFVSHPLNRDQRNTLLMSAKQSVLNAQSYAKSTKIDQQRRPLVFESIDVSPLVGYANRVNTATDMTVVAGDHIVRIQRHGWDDAPGQTKELVDALTKGLRLRPFDVVPSEHGVCLPYFFIKDDGQQGRSIGVTYRLQEHPDVTIWLEDSSAQSTTVDMPGGIAVKAKDASRFTAESKTEFFWSQRYQDRKSYRSLWSGARQVQLDGRRGVASFVELKRDDDTIDYGYLAVVRGDSEAKQDTPDLMLYVIRDAKNAIAKGKQPIDKDEFIKMAQSIAASVKRRPMQ